MNKIYRIVWSMSRNDYIVAHERAASRGKPSSTRKSGGLSALMLGLAGSFALAAPPPGALPGGGQIVGGAAAGAIGVNGNAMTLTQLQPRMIANWNSFSIGADASVHFQQPSASAIALNRVTGQSPSEIFGRLSANGQVMLVNPSGILFGAGGQVNTGGLLASTLAISDAGFMEGKYSFSRDGTGGTPGSIINQGKITTADGGVVVFIAPVVKNSGEISTPRGSTLLSAAGAVDIDFAGDGLISYRVNAGAAGALVENSGVIQADGGMAVLSAKAADAVSQAVVNNSGVVQARSLQSRNGRIVLDAGDAALPNGQVVQAGTLHADGDAQGGQIDVRAGYAVINTGSLSATGAVGGAITVDTRNLIEAGQYDVSGTTRGGSIHIAASKHIEQVRDSSLKANASQGMGGTVRVVAGDNAWLSGSASASGQQGGDIAITAPDLVMAGARLDASGQDGGGRIRVGGGWQGGDSDLANAEHTRMVNVHLDVSATDHGHGGTAVVWSEQQTLFGGTIKAEGGQAGGDGGAVEVSSHGQLSFGGTVSTKAPNGQNGRLLLDPKDIEIIDPPTGMTVLQLVSPTDSVNSFGHSGIVELRNNGVSIDRVAIASATDSAVAGSGGAVRLYDSKTGDLLASLTGLTNDQVGIGGIIQLGNGNFVVKSYAWQNGGFGVNANAGAVTWVNGTTGLNGVVSHLNSLVGTTTNDGVGSPGNTITVLSNGNYVVSSISWDNGMTGATNAGAVTWGSGTAGVSGAVSSANSLVGTQTGDSVGSHGVTALSNGNYVVRSTIWDNGTATNAGAVTWGSGTAGVSGVVSSSNSLVGTKSNDNVGDYGLTPLSNGNYVVNSPSWDNGTVVDAGAATWGSGTVGVKGEVSSSNSLVGTATSDFVGGGTTALSNGNYVVSSTSWHNGTTVSAGAATWGDGATGITGAVSSTNSLVGTQIGDIVGNTITALNNGNYVVRSTSWHNGTAANAGAITWGNGATGITGAVSSTNSLVGTAGDNVGSGGVTMLTNGNYVVVTPFWDNGTVVDAGAVTWGSGTAGITGAVSSANSLVGTTTNDNVGTNSSVATITVLGNGNYVVRSTVWNNGTATNAGAVTWGDGATGITGAVSSTNSLIGTRSSDKVGSDGITPLNNNNYVVLSTNWSNNGLTNAGAVTWGSGTAGVSGVVSSTNSLVGTFFNDFVGGNGIVALSNGNYVVRSPNWFNGPTGAANAGAVTWGSGTAGVKGEVSSSNSLVGTTTTDQVGFGGVTPLSNGNYVVNSYNWDNGPMGATNAGAVTWGNGATGITGAVSSTNSLVGTTTNDQVGVVPGPLSGVAALTNGNYIVRSSNWNNGTVADVGAVTWGNGTTGISGAVSTANSFVGARADDQVGSGAVIALSDGRALVQSPLVDLNTTANVGRVDILSSVSASPLTNPYTFATNSNNTSNLVNSDITALLNAGTNVTLQANNDITLTKAISANNPGGNGGNLTMQAGRSILVNANITTDNGNLTLIANEKAANGVIDAQRDSGAAAITMAAGTSINAGTGTVDIQLRDGAGLTNSTSGDISLRNITAGTISAVNSGATAGSGVVLNGTLTATANSGASIVLAGKKFTNNTGASALSVTNPARWLVWSGSPAADTRGGLAYGFKQYNATFGASTVLGSGNGFLYTIAPTITAGLTGTASKTYDGNANASLAAGNFTQSGALDGDSVAFSHTAASYADKNAGTGKAVTANGIAIDPASNGAAIVYGYQLASTSASANIGTINKKALTLTSVTADNKTYDGTTAANVSQYTLGGLVGSETLVGSNTGATFDTKNAGTGKTVSVAGIALADGTNGGLASNYSLGTTTATASADITKKALTLTSVTANNKTYDGNTAATISLYNLGGLIGSETLVGSNTGATFANKDAGTGKTVSVSGIALADGANGGLASNYSLGTTTATASADITKKALTLTSVTANNKIYDGNTAATISQYNLSGLVGSETLVGSNTGATFADKDAGTAKTVSVSGIALADGTNGGLASNYSLGTTTATTTADVTKKALTVTGMTANNKIYDGNTAATISVYNLGGLVGGETLVGSNTSATFANKDAGTGKTVSVAGIALANGANGGLASNYTVGATAATTADITKRALTLTSVTANNKTYDGTTAATISQYNLSGLIGIEALGGSNTGATFDTKDAGTGKTVSVSGIALVDGANGGLASNYSLGTTTATASADVTKKALTLTSVTANNKTYDGNTAATISQYSLSGLVGSETLVGGNTGATFDTKDAGTGKTVSVAGIALADGANGGLASNYSLGTTTATTTADVTKKALTVTGMTANNKIYDGNTAATISVYNLGGLVGGETLVGSNTSATFANKDAGTGKTVSVAGIALANGANGGLASNYTVGATAATTADITKRALTLTSVTANNKTYDGATAATISQYNLSGLIGIEALGGSNTGATFDTKDAGTGKTVSVAGIALANGANGGLASNYALGATTATASADITKKALTLTSVTANNKTYDGNTAATISQYNLSGLVGSETLAGTNTGATFANKNAGTGKTVSVSGIALADGTSGGLASNYSFGTTTASTTADVTKKALTLTGVTANSKVYDGTTNAVADVSGAALSGVVSGDTVSINTPGSIAFADKNAGVNKTLAASGWALSGADGGNYTVAGPGTLTADITKANLTLTGAVANNKVYDATTAATINTANASLAGVIGADSVNVTGAAGQFADRHAGTGKAVALTTYTLAGADAGNYNVSASGLGANIIPAALTVAAIADTKIFDGGTGSSRTPSVSGLKGSDLAVSAQTFDTSAVGTGKVLTPTVAINDGNGGGNYAVTVITASNGVITAPAPAAAPAPVSAPTPPIVVPPNINPFPNPGGGLSNPGQPAMPIDIRTLFGSGPDLIQYPNEPTGNKLGNGVGNQDTSPDALLAGIGNGPSDDTPGNNDRNADASFDGFPDGVRNRPAEETPGNGAGDGDASVDANPEAGPANAHADRSQENSDMEVMDDGSIRFRIDNAAQEFHKDLPVIADGEVLGLFRVDVAGGIVTVSKQAGTSASHVNESAAGNQAPIIVSIEDPATGEVLKFSINMANYELQIVLDDRAVRIVLGPPRNEDLVKMVIGRAVVDARTKLKAERIDGISINGGRL